MQATHFFFREADKVKLSPFYQGWTLQRSLGDWQSVIGISHCSKGRKGISKHVCETTEISKGYSRANIAPETTCNSHFVPEEVEHVGSVPLTALTPQSRQQQTLPASDQVSGDSKTHWVREKASVWLPERLKYFTEIAHSLVILLFSPLLLRTFPNFTFFAPTTSLTKSNPFPTKTEDQIPALNAPETKQQQVCTSGITWAWMTNIPLFLNA